jgi:hypothetical protein
MVPRKNTIPALNEPIQSLIRNGQRILKDAEVSFRRARIVKRFTHLSSQCPLNCGAKMAE